MTSTEVTIVKNDGSETFNLRVESVEPNLSHNFAVRSIVSGIGGLAGKDPVLQKETYNIEGRIQDMEAADYPNSGNYSDDDAGFETELRRAFKEWGPDSANGFDVLNWDTGFYTGGGSNPRVIDGLMTELSTPEDRSQDKARVYEFSMEWTHVDVYVG